VVWVRVQFMKLTSQNWEHEVDVREL